MNIYKNLNFKIKTIKEKDKGWVKNFIKKHWGSEKIVYSGKIFLPHKLSGFIAENNGKKLGLITYKIYKDYFQIITINSLVEKRGIGTTLIKEVKKEAKKLGGKKIKVITTNDNLDALHFYQKRGFRIKKIYQGTVDKSRKIKPEIPQIGENGIPIKDEIELELTL